MMAYSKTEILEKTKQLANTIAETDEVVQYKAIEQQLNANEKFSRLMEQRKKLQKESVNLEQLGKLEALAEAELQLTDLNKTIDEMPIVEEFKHAQNEVNEILQMVTSIITSELDK